MSETENSTSTKDNNIKKSSDFPPSSSSSPSVEAGGSGEGRRIITPFSPDAQTTTSSSDSSGVGEAQQQVITPLGDRQPGETIIELGDRMPSEISLKPAREPPNKFYTIKSDRQRSKESIQKEQELRRESMIDSIKESLRANRSGAEVIRDLDIDMSGAALAELVREARSRLERERAEQQSIIEDRRAEFQRRLEASRFVCPHCGAICGWTDESEINHLKTCVRYHEHKKAEEEKMQRRRNFVNRYERLLDFDIPSISSSVTDVVETINNLRWTENEAKYSTTKDGAIIEGMQHIKERISSESDYDRRRRQKQIANIRNAATAIEALYRRLEEEPEEEQSE
jgi:hypothetical protein